MRRFLAGTAACAIVYVWAGWTALGAPNTADLYAAIRSNDLSRLKTLVTSPADANVRDQAGETPLMYAAAAGSVDAMQWLLDKGADVNVQNGFGSTALIWSATEIGKVKLLLDHGATVGLASKTGRTALLVAAMTDESSAIVRLLASKGADVKAKDAFQNTLLMAAVIGNDLDTIRFALNAGVDVNAASVTGMTPLLVASYQANHEVVKLLLSKGAQVNVTAKAPLLFPGEDPKSGPLSLGGMTPLLAASGAGSAEIARALLDAGADINAKDVRHMTALMLAVATNHQNPALIRLLVERGADAGLQSTVGETAADWARKLGTPHGLSILKLTPREVPAAADSPAPVGARAAAERSLALLESSSQKFFESSGCVSCHHQNITDLATGEARAKGLRVNEQAAAERLKMLAAGPPAQLLLERMDINVPEIFGATLTALAAVNYPPDQATDRLVANIAATQVADGSWHVVNGLGDRPPAEEGAITRTALSIRSLKVYGPPARATEIDARIARARRWLSAATPVTSEDRNMQLLGLYWSGADAATMKPLAAAILAQQQPDGGWRQHVGVRTDAYATGQSLYAVAKAGVSPGGPPYQRGVKFLLTTQAANGSWRVASRSPKFQAYFNSGFPYAGDQWISAWATGWATMALAQAVE